MSIDPISFSSSATGATPYGGTSSLVPVSANSPLPVANGVTPFQSLLAQTALNTQGSTLDCLVSRANHTLFVVAAAGVTGGVVTLMGSMDNQNWVATSATVTTSAAGAFAASLTNTPYRYLAAKITTVISGGGAPSVTAYVGSC
jgi:hypothetical protein